MKTLLIINDPPYGTERAYNALRLANTLIKREGEEARVFLMADAALCAKAGPADTKPARKAPNKKVEPKFLSGFIVGPPGVKLTI